MPELADVSTDDLQTALDAVDEKRPALRLVAAIAHKHGVTQTELAEWLEVERKTVYNWLQRIETADDLVEAVRDEPRPGRPRKLSDTQYAVLDAAVDDTPETYGYDAPAWSADVLRSFVRNEFQVEYSLPSCRRLLDELTD